MGSSLLFGVAFLGNAPPGPTDPFRTRLSLPVPQPAQGPGQSFGACQ